MANATKRPGRSFADERQLIEMAKAFGLETIVKRTGRKTEAVLKMAKRLGLPIYGKGKTRATR
jgi:hypothetical protein